MFLISIDYHFSNNFFNDKTGFITKNVATSVFDYI